MMIGNKIRDLRKEKKLSQNELGKSIGVSLQQFVDKFQQTYNSNLDASICPIHQ